MLGTRDMPDSVVRGKLESLGIHVQGVTQLRSGRRDQDPIKDRKPNPQLHCISAARAWGVQGAINHRTLRPASVGGAVRGSKGPFSMQALPGLRKYAAKLQIRVSVRGVWGLPPLRWVLHTAGAASVCGCGGNHTANYRGCAKWK